ncbi:hypothetical protein PSQ20_00120 [Curvibacter sp. RS43]|uniref:hypothetical protein n=1 Tax=Curvibacter microcysteis TaxID=3026419 RepID=UPI00236300DB|nr:hypothetical protein [Curvibacter sp. RS43]MDD0808728.1 hypothetical protein [Curvibacter sp. RS43]
MKFLKKIPRGIIGTCSSHLVMVCRDYLPEVLFLLFTLSARVLAADHGLENQDFNLDSILFNRLSSAPHGGVVLSTNLKNRIAEYCPDETCDRLIAPARISRKIFNSLAFVYFARLSGYSHLEGWVGDGELSEVKNLLNDTPEYCRCTMKIEWARCLVKWGAKNHGLRLYSVRHDEGRKFVSKINIEKY